VRAGRGVRCVCSVWRHWHHRVAGCEKDPARNSQPHIPHIPHVPPFQPLGGTPDRTYLTYLTYPLRKLLHSRGGMCGGSSHLPPGVYKSFRRGYVRYVRYVRVGWCKSLGRGYVRYVRYVWSVGTHTHTAGGVPLCCAVGRVMPYTNTPRLAHGLRAQVRVGSVGRRSACIFAQRKGHSTRTHT
jgi:hypothetical protein